MRLEDLADNAVLKHGDIEVDKQANFATGQFEVGQQLSLMNGVHAVDRFQFKDDFPFNQEIKAVAAFQSQPFVFYWQWFLLYELQAPQGKLSGKTSLIN